MRGNGGHDLALHPGVQEAVTVLREDRPPGALPVRAEICPPGRIPGALPQAVPDAPAADCRARLHHLPLGPDPAQARGRGGQSRRKLR